MSKGFDGRDVSYRIRHTDSNQRCTGNRDEILHLLRGRMEREHRCLAFRWASGYGKSYTIAAGKYKPVVMKHLYDSYKLYDMIPHYNKSVMIYTLDPKWEAGDIDTGILKFLDIWLYRQWFKPYQSDIEFGRYVAKTTLLWWKKESPKPSHDEINHFHKSLCHDLTNGMFESMSPRVRNYLKTYYLNIEKKTSKKRTLAAFNKSYIVQPTFQSFFIVMERTHGLIERPFRADDIGNIPVHLVCTRCNNQAYSRGASSDDLGPCCTIQTTMEAAIRFIMDLGI
ncbi:hypothetical protein FSPOR_11882 [Fusarium sporotrichioides]|uniref:Uncharacterized protein n=1 Tax=Fusarium sporotrichioides TaxID=5514 RepID=A0A395REQ9_FUSSP|nr:hypothetical protein FSPOR_11882 [Fusarium sporotrichioides]